MNGLRRSRWMVLVSLAAMAGGARGQAVPEPETAEEIVEQILELRERLELLMQALPPELRREVERRWRERRRAAGDESGTTLPTPAPELREPAASAPTDPGTAAPPPPSAAPTCGTLYALDSNQDGLVSAADRYWRYLRLWAGSGDGEPEQGELATLYELGIRQLDVGLTRFQTSDDSRGDVTVDVDGVRLELLGKAASFAGSALLAIDAGRLARSGELRLIDASGEPLAGYRALRPGVALESADGSRWPIACPTAGRPPA